MKKAPPHRAASAPARAKSANKLDKLHGVVRLLQEHNTSVRVCGTVSQITPGYYGISGLEKHVCIGDCIELDVMRPYGRGPARAEVIRIDEGKVYAKPYSQHLDVGIGTRVMRMGPVQLSPDNSWLGRVIDSLGRPIDNRGMLVPGRLSVSLEGDPPPAMERSMIEKPIRTGVRAIDLFTPLCVGQRIGVFAGSGVGKSTLLAMLASALDFEVVVVALVGERGREVREFIEGTLGEALTKSVVVVATGDESPMMRRQAPKTAMAIAEHFRDQGLSVLMIMDSATRFAQAARDVAMASGEPAVARGYTPSVFSELPRLLERAGPGRVPEHESEPCGAITGIFSVLVDGDDHNDPVADSIRGILDGHIVLDRAIADQGRYPAIDVLSSVSRMANKAWNKNEAQLIMKLKSMITRYEETRDLRLLGGYTKGADAELDHAMLLIPSIYDILCQTPHEMVPANEIDDPFRELSDALTAKEIKD
ncbi:flagellar protein export ATPase FliI [Cohaesibacter celericrescens]|uniref:Flagellum-specific ATP synthase n=1 Tax=Cohaesibacter celericrescens TaxID=2067669 RepID=A0A2N5XLU4_9HYPH|nr:flagellar protein export ATPase FliI [Cohaesibacter celericrescens]PLW75506.1 flagellum-specific ATP synthase FliI [Cohaesibacter celericrescens]PLW78913.1 flagellum-specific ATP synthase FliI [Cohaesibacter celericrescens]